MRWIKSITNQDYSAPHLAAPSCNDGKGGTLLLSWDSWANGDVRKDQQKESKGYTSTLGILCLLWPFGMAKTGIAGTLITQLDSWKTISFAVTAILWKCVAAKHCYQGTLPLKHYFQIDKRNISQKSHQSMSGVSELSACSVTAWTAWL